MQVVYIWYTIFTGGYTCSLDKKDPNVKVSPHATCVSTIAEYFEYSLLMISKHLKELRETNAMYT